MTPRIVLQQAGTVPNDATVQHFDELEPAVQDQLPELTSRGGGRVSADVAAGFEECELVKFTDYYHVHHL
ncbi:hypothetical protein VB773_10305 [Haloarculaceae archaeon H-GB2-1]|nr:hypothetical protein [Haloarculaceae archaeon H-GB1-1]MEA5386401.1 hypothetical protein [Haloarculaceae archaeon H-GB11]MEA5407911.1 hypothetical protein [Haloarculaceae archaeon H-GB2-1]